MNLFAEEARNTNPAIPMFTGISEIVMVVEDLDAAVRRQWDMFGIGPWEIWTLDSSTVKDMVTHKQPADFSIRVAYTKIGATHWEPNCRMDRAQQERAMGVPASKLKSNRKATMMKMHRMSETLTKVDTFAAWVRVADNKNCMKEWKMLSC